MKPGQAACHRVVAPYRGPAVTSGETDKGLAFPELGAVRIRMKGCCVYESHKLVRLRIVCWCNTHPAMAGRHRLTMRSRALSGVNSAWHTVSRNTTYPPSCGRHSPRVRTRRLPRMTEVGSSSPERQSLRVRDGGAARAWKAGQGPLQQKDRAPCG